VANPNDFNESCRDELFRAIRDLIDRRAIDSVEDLGRSRFLHLRDVLTPSQMHALTFPVRPAGIPAGEAERTTPGAPEPQSSAEAHGDRGRPSSVARAQGNQAVPSSAAQPANPPPRSSPVRSADDERSVEKRELSRRQQDREELFAAILGLLDQGAIDCITDLGQTRFARLLAVFTDEQLNRLLDRPGTSHPSLGQGET
jgi:hypothetical protein